MVSFSKQVGDWSKKTKQDTRTVFVNSLRRMFQLAQLPVFAGGRMPVDTNFLRASFVATLDAPVTTVTFKPKGILSFSGDGEYEGTLARTQIGDEVFGTWTAWHARFQNYGTSRNQAWHFRGFAAQQWGNIVRSEAARVRRS